MKLDEWLIDVFLVSGCFASRLHCFSIFYLGDAVDFQGFGFACLALGMEWLGCWLIPSVADLTQV